MIPESGKVTAWVSANISLAAISTWINQIESVFKMLVSVGQLAVAVVTVIYVAVKIRNARKRKRVTKRKR